MVAEERILTGDWNLYDTRHVVFRPTKLTAEALESGYWSAYREFYRWSNIFQSSSVQTGWMEQLRHIAYVGGWKKFEPLWDWVIRAKRVASFLPLLEKILASKDKTLHGAAHQSESDMIESNA
jgi:hypothetical protein